MKRDIVIIGAGPAGLAAALEAQKRGVDDIVLLERDFETGGILNQCIHSGFGLQYFHEELTGPEYAQRFSEELAKTNAQVLLNTMAIELTPDKKVIAMNAKDGVVELEGKAVVLAMGCRERPRGALGIPGTRPSGIFTAGTAQRYVNMDGRMIGRKVLILGSGDIGLIMARRMTLEGAEVVACVELMPYSAGLRRNIVQCLDDFGIPLYLSSTITQIKGEHRVCGAVVARVDQDKKPIPGSEKLIECDTILLSVGLIPENELTRSAGALMDMRTKGPIVYENTQTTLPGVFACGNVAQVHDLVDFVTMESIRAGSAAAEYVLHPTVDESPYFNVYAGKGLTYVLPQRVHADAKEPILELFFRVSNVYRDIVFEVASEDGRAARYRRDFAVPGEMVRLKVPRKLLSGTDITVSLKENAND